MNELFWLLFFVILMWIGGNKKIWNNLSERIVKHLNENWRDPNPGREEAIQNKIYGSVANLDAIANRIFGLIGYSGLLYTILTYVLTNHGIERFIMACFILLMLRLRRQI